MRQLVRAERQIREYLAGRRKAFTVPVDLRGLAPFHAKALAACGRIPYGATVSYGRLAERIGKAGAARAVGQAMASNPVPLVIPCHRVVASDGDLGGFMGGTAGLGLKRRLLELEGRSKVQSQRPKVKGIALAVGSRLKAPRPHLAGALPTS